MDFGQNDFEWIGKINKDLTLGHLASRQILVPRTSLGRPLPTSPGRPITILFDRPGDVPIRRLKGRPNLTSWIRPERTSRERPNLMFKGRHWEVDSGRPLEDLKSTQIWMFKELFQLFFQNLFD